MTVSTTRQGLILALILPIFGCAGSPGNGRVLNPVELVDGQARVTRADHRDLWYVNDSIAPIWVNLCVSLLYEHQPTSAELRGFPFWRYEIEVVPKDFLILRVREDTLVLWNASAARGAQDCDELAKSLLR